jgi:M6 family metalloprotease-like protein
MYDSRKSAPTVGTINNLVVFIRFSDEAEFTDAVSLYDQIFNDPAGVSLKNYFTEASYSALNISSTLYPVPPSATIVSYQDAYPRSYYQPYSVTNPNGYSSDQEATREGVLVENALNYIKSQVPAGLDVDTDDDGLVDNICFIIDGSPTAWATLLWPHKTSLSSSRFVIINGAQCSSYNLQLQSSVKSSGPSPLAHEIFHTLGSSDLYHYTDNGMNPVGGWDLMASNKKPPQHMTAYMKFRYGKWIAEIPEITQSGTYELNPLISSTNNCFKLRSPGSADEYFVLEYRKKTGLFETSISSEGLLIYRINTTVASGNRNGPPDAVYIYRPDGTFNYDGTLTSATFTSASSRTAFNNYTNPSCFLSDGSKGNIKISDIGSTGSTITFTVTIDDVYAALKTPVPQAQCIAGTSRTVEWISGGGAGTMLLDYSDDNGQTWNLINNSATSPFAWTIPDTPSMSCKLRIRSNSISGIADSTSFAITLPFSPLNSMYDATDVTGGASNSGIAIVGNEFWTSRYNSAFLHRWNMNGTLIEEFSVTGVTGIRSLTYDGVYVYATTSSNKLYKIETITKALLETVALPITSRFASFDQLADNGLGGFWIGNTTGDWILVNRSGSELSRITMAKHGLSNVYGLACDNLSSYKPSLWAYIRSGGNAGTPQYIVQVKLPGGIQTGMFHDVLQEVGPGAGNPAGSGLSIGTNLATGKVLLSGVNSGTPNWLFFYDFSNIDNEPISLNTLDVPYSENFNSLGIESAFGLYDNISIPGIYAYRTLDNAVPNIFNKSAGGTVTGGFFNYGTSSTSADRALGGIQSSITSTLYYGIRLRNNTGSTISSLDVTYTGEQWRIGGSSTVQIINVLAFEYLQSPKVPDLKYGTYTPFEALSFKSPKTYPYYTSIDGNNSANRTTLTATIPVSIPVGEEIMLRWKDVEDASYDHALAIDDFSVTPRSVFTEAENTTDGNANILIYPNPANDILNISCSNAKAQSIAVYDITGNCILSEKISSDIQVVNVTRFVKGLYFIKIRCSGKTYTGKFVKN